MDAIQLLHNRNSAPRLCEPAPDNETLELMLQAALRAPDHARLRPWRFLHISGESRTALGQLFADAARKRGGALSAADIEKCQKQPFRAPMILVVIAVTNEHPKVPRLEQQLSAGCAAHAVLLAAEARGFAGVWRTGTNAYDDTIKQGLGLGADEEIIAFLYLGTREGRAKSLPVLDKDDFCQSWPGVE